MNLLLQVLQTVLTVSLVIGLVWLTGKLLGKRAGYRWRKILWLVLAVRLLFPFQLSLGEITESFRGLEIAVNIPADVPVAAPMSAREQIPEATAVVADTAEKVNTSPAEEVVPMQEGLTADTAAVGRTFSLAGCIAFVWGAGVLLLLGARAYQYGMLKKRYLAETIPCEDSYVLECRNRLCKELQIQSVVSIRRIPLNQKVDSGLHSELANSPMLFGYFNTMLLLPEQDYSAKELEAIIRHELTHLRARDLWYKLLMMVVCDIYWFNPLFRLMKKMAFHDVEFVCDEKATSEMNLDAKKDYSNTILKTMSGTKGANLVFATRFAGTKKSAKERFENIFASHNRKTGMIILAALVLVLVAGTIFVSVTVLEDDEEIAVAENEAEEVVNHENEVLEEETVAVEEEVVETAKTITIDSNILWGYPETLLDELGNNYPQYNFSSQDLTLNYKTEEFYEQAPTVFWVSNLDTLPLAEKGYLADITDVLAARGWLEQMDESRKATVSDENGRVYGIPMSPYTFGLAVNVELFAQAGLVDEAGMPLIPSTWEELAQTARTIKNATGKAGICMITNEEGIGTLQFYNLAWNFGLTEFVSVEEDGSYKTHLDSEAAIEAMKFIKALKWEYDVLTEDPSKENLVTGYEKLANGTAAMFIGASDALGIPVGYGMSAENIAMGAVPAGPDGDQYTYYANGVYAFPADAEPEEIDAILTLIEMMGLGPVANDAAKERIQSNVEGAVSQGAPAIKSIPVWNNAELLEYEESVLAESGNTNQALYQSYYEKVFTPGNLKSTDDLIGGSELTMILGDVLKTVVTDPNADVEAMMKTANDDWQKVVTIYSTQ